MAGCNCKDCPSSGGCPSEKQPIVEKVRMPFNVEWMHSVYQIKDEQGNLREAGTVLNVCNAIVFLSPLSEAQLKHLKKTVADAVDYELKHRNS
jgi:hypothetical protein